MTKIGPLSLSGRTKIIVSLMGKNISELKKTLLRLDKTPVDIIEWRIDYLTPLCAETVNKVLCQLRQLTDKPILATLRTSKEGGLAEISVSDYKSILSELIASNKIDALDIEIERTCSKQLIESAKKRKLPTVASYHDFEKTPSLLSIRAKLKKMARFEADILKIALMPLCTKDVITLIKASLWARSGLRKPLITISMGQTGSITRVAANFTGSVATFASLDSSSAPGQFSIKETLYFLELFKHKKL